MHHTGWSPGKTPRDPIIGCKNSPPKTVEDHAEKHAGINRRNNCSTIRAKRKSGSNTTELQHCGKKHTNAWPPPTLPSPSSSRRRQPELRVSRQHSVLAVGLTPVAPHFQAKSTEPECCRPVPWRTPFRGRSPLPSRGPSRVQARSGAARALRNADNEPRRRNSKSRHDAMIMQVIALSFRTLTQARSPEGTKQEKFLSLGISEARADIDGTARDIAARFRASRIKWRVARPIPRNDC